MTEPVIKTIEVGCTAERAFEIFVADTNNWWPLDRHSVSAGEGKSAKSVVIEPKSGGAVYEIKHDGERCEWGLVLEYEPARALAMTWHPGQGDDAATRVDVRFEESPEGGAIVTLTHSGWEVLGDVAQARRDGYSSGWVFVFEDRFAVACQ